VFLVARRLLQGEGAAGESVAVNSLALLDLLQIAARGLAPKAQYQVSLVTSNRIEIGRPTPF